jgi:hypothetical protein
VTCSVTMVWGRRSGWQHMSKSLLARDGGRRCRFGGRCVRGSNKLSRHETTSEYARRPLAHSHHPSDRSHLNTSPWIILERSRHLERASRRSARGASSGRAATHGPRYADTASSVPPSRLGRPGPSSMSRSRLARWRTRCACSRARSRHAQD